LIAASVLSGWLALATWWDCANLLSRDPQSSRRWGLLKVLCVVAGLGLLGFGAVFGAAIPTAYHVAVARLAYDKFTMGVDVLRHEIHIAGLIGPGLGRRLENFFDTHAGIRRISITSPGGLVDEGLRAAAAIERHRGVEVVARKECNSAGLNVSGPSAFAVSRMEAGTPCARRYSSAAWPSPSTP
jgi:hypothetical protein